MTNQFRIFLGPIGASAICFGAIFAANSAQSTDRQIYCAEAISPATALSVGIAAIYKTQLYATYLGKGNIKKLEPIVYQGIPDFLARNTGCCSFTPLGQDDFAPTPEWSERNSFYGFVRATFEAHWTEDEENRKPVVVTRIVAVTTCGEAIWYDVDDDDW